MEEVVNHFQEVQDNDTAVVQFVNRYFASDFEVFDMEFLLNQLCSVEVECVK